MHQVLKNQHILYTGSWHLCCDREEAENVLSMFGSRGENDTVQEYGHIYIIEGEAQYVIEPSMCQLKDPDYVHFNQDWIPLSKYMVSTDDKIKKLMRENHNLRGRC